MPKHAEANLLGYVALAATIDDGSIGDVARIVRGFRDPNSCFAGRLTHSREWVSMSRVRTMSRRTVALCVHPMSWLSVTDHDFPTRTDRRWLGVTRVSQVGTFGDGLARTGMYEKRCK